MKTSNFNEWIRESADHEERLRELGLSTPTPAQALREFRQKWGANPRIQEALSTIRRETRQLGWKYKEWVSEEDPELEELVDDPATDNWEWFAQQFFTNWL